MTIAVRSLQPVVLCFLLVLGIALLGLNGHLLERVQEGMVTSQSFSKRTPVPMSLRSEPSPSSNDQAGTITPPTLTTDGVARPTTSPRGPHIAKSAYELPELQKRKKGGGGGGGSSHSGDIFDNLTAELRKTFAAYIVVEVWAGLVVAYVVLHFLVGRASPNSWFLWVKTDMLIGGVLVALGIGGVAAATARGGGPPKINAMLALGWILWVALLGLVAAEAYYVRTYFPGDENQRSSLLKLSEGAGAGQTRRTAGAAITAKDLASQHPTHPIIKASEKISVQNLQQKFSVPAPQRPPMTASDLQKVQVTKASEKISVQNLQRKFSVPTPQRPPMTASDLRRVHVTNR